MSKTFCPLPFAHIATNTDGDIVACCHSTSSILREDGKPFNLANGDSFEKAFRSEYMQSLRRNLLSGVQDPQCSLCWKMEDYGLESKRQNENHRLPEVEAKASENPSFEPLTWDLKLGSHCNLKCRMCFVGTSSAIMNEAIENGWVDGETGRARSKRTLNFLKYPGVKEELKKLIPIVKEMYFLGGEPTLMREHLELLDFAIELGHAKSICIRWSTNLTRFDKEFTDRAKHFSKVILDCSIDGFAEVNDYIRFPSQWAVVVERLSEIRRDLPHARVKAVCTVQIYNIFELEKMIQWCEEAGVELSFNFLDDPSHLSVQALPLAIKRQIRAKYEPMGHPLLKLALQWLGGSVDQSNFGEFIRYTNRLDFTRKQRFQDIVPEEFRSLVFSSNIFRSTRADSSVEHSADLAQP